MGWIIKKEMIEKKITVIMNNSIGEVLEIADEHTARLLVETLNANSDSNCRYTLHRIKDI